MSETEPSAPSAREWAALLALILGSAVLASAMLTRGHDWGDDFASYLMQAISIVNGTIAEFVEQNRFTIEHSTSQLGPVAYPWGLPLLLAAVYRLFGFNLLAFKALSLVFYVVFLIVLAIYLRRRHSFPYLMAIMAIFAVNPFMVTYLDQILSDIPFLLFSTICVYLIDRTIVERRTLLSRWADQLLLGAVMVMCTFIRTAGVTLVVTAIGAQIIAAVTAMVGRARSSGPRRASGVGFPALLPYVTFAALMLLVRTILPDEQASYMAPHVRASGGTGVTAGIISTARYYFELPVDFVGDVPYASGVYFATLPFLFAGMANSIKRDYHIVLYACVTIAAYCIVWPGRAGLRFLFPLLPFYVHFMCGGLAWYAEALGGLSGKVAKLVSLCVLVVILTYWVRTDVRQAVANIENDRLTIYDAFAPATMNLYDFVRANVPEDAVIVFFKPRAMRLATRRHSVQIANPERLTIGDYLCIYVGWSSYNQIPLRAVDQLVSNGELTTLYTNSDFRLYRINRVHARGRDGPRPCAA